MQPERIVCIFIDHFLRIGAPDTKLRRWSKSNPNPQVVYDADKLSASLTRQLQMETKILRRIQHSGCVAIHDVFEERRNPSIYLLTLTLTLILTLIGGTWGPHHLPCHGCALRT